MVVVFDLDDTLYDEIDFVKSGFKAIALYLQEPFYYDFMMEVFEKEGSGKVFNRLIEKYNLEVPLLKLIEIYKFHTPQIRLNTTTTTLLAFCKKYPTALISDSNYLTQENKFKALHLEDYINYPIFTDFHMTHKPEVKAYKMVMQKFADETQFVYISDNPNKDFIAVETLGWRGIRYKNPVGIYRDSKNTTDYEVDDKSKIIAILQQLEKEFA